MSEPSHESSTCNAARQIASVKDRDAYVKEACGGDAAMQARVQRLLLACDAESQDLEQPAAELDGTTIHDMAPEAGGASMLAGQVQDALDYFRIARGVAEQRVAAAPDDAGRQRFLFDISRDLGAASLQAGGYRLVNMTPRLEGRVVDWPHVREAAVYYQHALTVLQKRAAADPPNIDARRDVIEHHLVLAAIHKTLDEFDLALTEYRTAVDAMKVVADANGPGSKQARQFLPALEKLAGRVHVIRTSLGEWSAVSGQPAEQLPLLLQTRAIQLANRARYDEAAQAAAMLVDLADADSGHLYNAACVFSLCAASTAPQEGKELTEEQSARRQKLIESALASLKRSVELGWDDFGHMQNDPDLSPLRDLPEFKTLIGK